MIRTKVLGPIHALTPTTTSFPLCMYTVKRQTVHVLGGHHTTAVISNISIMRKQRPAPRCCRALQWVHVNVLAWSRVSPSNYCVLQSYWPLWKVRGCVHSQSVFCTLSLFFWIFWCTTFNVVRKFPRNRTRNVSASIKTCHSLQSSCPAKWNKVTEL